MFMFGIGVALFLASLVFAHVLSGNDEARAAWVARIVGLVALVATFALGCFYPQDAGEVIVKRNLGGSLAGYTEEAGFHGKWPWQSVISYDIRSNIISLYRDADYTYDGGSANGACVTVNDKGGASADVDIQVTYSLDADSALRLYENYGTQEYFTSTVVQNDVRATARMVSGGYDTKTMLTDRSKFKDGLESALSERWSEYGLIVEQVLVQDVRYSKGIHDAFDSAQESEIAKQKAENDQKVAEAEKEVKKLRAEGDAIANDVITESLTPELIQQHYIDALVEIGKDGNLVIVPEGSQPLVQVGDGE